MHAGVKWGEVNVRYGCPYCRTCRFDNVCLNHSTMAIQFYHDPESQGPLFYDFAGQPHYTFPADFINTGGLPWLGPPQLMLCLHLLKKASIVHDSGPVLIGEDLCLPHTMPKQA